MTIPDKLITTYLELRQKSDFQPAFVEDDRSFYIKIMDFPDIAFYRFLYTEVGKIWRWRDRLLLDDDKLLDILASPDTKIYVLYVQGVPAGYIELAVQNDDAEIAYFGLREQFFGKGFGKHLLSYGVNEAWKIGAKRIWLHTCNLDGPQALTNYQKRGFQVYDVVEEPMPQRYE